MKPLLCLFFAAVAVFAQSQTKVSPDCIQPFDFNAAGNGSNFDNRTISAQNGVPCRYWTISYYTNGFSGLTLTVQSAQDSNGTPGSFSAFAGTVVTGSNPNTATTSATTDLNGYFPWMRVVLSGLTGSGNVHGSLNGWRTNQATIASGATSSGCPGTTTTPCVIAGQNSGGAVIPIVGAAPAAVTLTTSGLTRIVTNGGGATRIRVTHLSLSFASAVDFQLEYGTQTTTACDTGTTALTGVYKTILSLALDFDLNSLNVPAAQDLCVNLGSSVTGGGLVMSTTF